MGVLYEMNWYLVLGDNVYKNTTEINFSYVKKFDFDSDISKHYYNMYLHMKNKS